MSFSDPAIAEGKSGSHISRGAREGELEALLHSGLVRDHTQLRSLLAYLGNRSLEDAPAPLKEYTIGVEALNKPADYDPRLDPTVRVEVARLRKKLQEFYQGPGAGHAVQMVIPKGSYVPAFVPRSVFAGAKAGNPRLRVSAGVIAVALIALLLLWRRTPERPQLAPELEAFWAPHLTGSEPTLLVYGTPMFTKLSGSFFRDPNVNTTEQAAASQRLQRVTAAVQPQEVRPVFSFTGAGEAEGLFLITRALAASRVPVSAHPSSSISWDGLKGKHAVLLGGWKYNRIIPELPFKPRFQAVARAIVDLASPGPEGQAYRTASKTPHGEITEEYSLVSVYPGLSPETRLVILEGSSTEGTLAAAEFVTRADTLRELMKRKAPLVRHAEPVRPFQVVVGAKLNKGVVVSLFYVTHAPLS